MKGSTIRMVAIWSLFVFIAPLAFEVWASRAFALDHDETAGESLAGLPGIAVMVLLLNPELEQNGLKRAALQSDVEAKLHKSGIKMATEREMQRGGFPYLSVLVNVEKNKDPKLHTYDIKVEMYEQSVINPQDAAEHFGFAIYDTIKIWSSELSGTVASGDFKTSIQKQVDDGVDKFINAYFAANPKAAPGDGDNNGKQ